MYSEYKAHANIWTKTNNYKDLCRYNGAKFIFFRHLTQDFIVQYDIQPPFDITKETYMQAHPYLMLLQKNHKLILSQKTKPNGRLTKAIKIKPPKEMQTGWFFQKQFAEKTLLTIKASALNLNYSYIQCCNENLQLSIYYLDINLYQFGNWGNISYKYHPYNTAPTTKKYYCKNIKGDKYEFNLDASDYTKSVSYNTGWFAPKFLQAVQLLDSTYSTPTQDALPINYCIYNPAIDEGPGNKIFLHSLTSESYRLPQDENLAIYNVPLWLGLWGFLDWIRKNLTLHILQLTAFAYKAKHYN